MANKIFLLAYPRSGSSVIRLFIAHLTNMNPCQPGGGVEAPLAALITELNLQGAFYKYHFMPKDGPFNAGIDPQDTLIQVSRDPLENLVSWTFSYLHRKHTQIDTSRNGELASKFIRGRDGTLTNNIENFKKNRTFYNNFAGKKVDIEFEKALADPEYMIATLRTVVEVTEESAKHFRKNFEDLKKKMMEAKSGPLDSIRVNTFGNSTYWRDLLSPEDIKQFWELYGERI